MKKRIAAGIAFAVCAAAVIGLLSYDRSEGGEWNSGEIRVFDNYGQIEKVLGGIKDDEPVVHAMGGDVIVEEDIAEAPAGNLAEAPATGTGPDGAVEGGDAKSAEFSDTYLQVEGVDEADIIKTDGKYIYYTSRLSYDVIIAKVEDGKVVDAAVISEEEMGISADSIFLAGDRLVVVGTDFGDPDEYYVPTKVINATACVYDVSDPEKPELVGKYAQSGSLVSARVTDGFLYMISTDYLNKGDRRIVPLAGTGSVMEKLEANHISCFPNPQNRAYAVIGSVKVDSAKGNLKTKTRAVLGTSDDIYCSGRSIYLTDYRMDFGSMDGTVSDERTYIMKAEISKGKVAFAKQGSVRGSVLNQFSMDEKDGYFRIATTARVKGQDVNYLYVLDEDLEVCGKVKGFAAGEQIKAVRYLGDTAYVITYRQTDPLFVIDLSDSEKPEMRGNVEITGFSSLLLPEGEDKIIGIGTATSEGEFGEVENGVKIALFDISDPEKPEVLDSMTYMDYSSNVQYDHRALTVNSSEGWYAVPYSVWDNDTGGVIQFRVSGNMLEEMNNYKGEKCIDRCLFIDDYIYGLESYEDEIISWNLAH